MDYNVTRQPGRELLIVMTVYDGNVPDDTEDVILNQRIYNYLDEQTRQKIAKTAWWALHNGHEFILRPLGKDEEVEIVGHDLRARHHQQNQYHQRPTRRSRPYEPNYRDESY